MRSILLLINVLNFIVAPAQDIRFQKHDSIVLSRALITKLDWPSATDSIPQHASFPFNNFVFIDVRADTGYLGVKMLTSGGSGARNFAKVNFAKSTCPTLEHYMNTNTGFSFASNKTSLVSFIKQLRLTQIDTVTMLNSKKVSCRFRVAIESYLLRDSQYYPALRIDTLITLFASKGDRDHIITNAFEWLTVKASLLNPELCFKRKSYTFADLDKKYKERFNLPILTAHELNKGVYKTFGEFINNAPSHKEYEFIKDKTVAILYTKDNAGRSVPERNAFGFCDGKVIWINANRTFRPLVRRGNTFEFLAEYTFSHPGNMYVSAPTAGATLGASLIATAINNAASEINEAFLYQIDIETGAF